MLLIVCVAAVGGIAAPAVAFFSSSGTGTGTGATATLLPLAIQSATTGSPSSALFPGGTGDLVLTVANPNPGPVTIVGIAQGGPVNVTGGTGCSSDSGWPAPVGNSGVSVPVVTGLNISVAGEATQVVHVPGAASMSTTSAAGCQGASFQIPITVQVVQ